MASACGGGDIGSYGPVSFSADHPRIYMKSHKDALVAALKAGTPEATRFKDMVDKWVGGGDVYNFFSWNAALLGQLTGDPKYCAAAIKDVDQQVNDATSQVTGGKLPDVAGDDYLDVGNMIGNLALVYDWCAGSLSADRRGAWLSYADQAVYNVWKPDAAAWGNLKAQWSGWAIDDPSDNYFYSFLRATMLLGLAAHGETPRAEGWLSQFRDTKLGKELVPVFTSQLAGGGSREGTGYGVSQRDVFELYDLWEGSTGERIADLTPHTRASMLSFMHQMVPTLDRIAPTGDQSRDSTAAFFDYHRSYLQDLISLYPADPVAPRAQALLAASSLPQMGQPFMFASDFIYANKNVTASTLDGLNTAYYAPGIGEVYARSGWDKHATWVNLIAGPYTQSHAHQDQGSLMLYKDGWLAYDAVVDSHSGLTQATTAHSVVRLINGGNIVEQQANYDLSKQDSKVLALHQDKTKGYVHVAADLTNAYGGQSAVQMVQREMVYIQPDTVVVYDRLSTKVGGQVVFQLVSPVSPPTATGTTHTFTTIVNPPKTTVAHTLTLEDVITPPGTTPSIVDMSKEDSDFMGGFRLEETAAAATNNRFLHVLTIDGAASNIASSGSDGVTMMIGGQAATVSFNHDNVGATLTLGGQTITLAAGVDPLAE
ncbi:MAG TPA: hypothetical protein VHW23_11760 [Kofleriaceae bacterium]|nr:hypothetical protein [Kofleriaceae bacterium]